MILRRIIAHFRKQEWTAIGIDFVIVVIGVLIGLQVNEWAARQADAQRGRAYVQRLIADVETDLAFRRSTVAYFDAVNEGAQRTNALLLNPRPGDAQALVLNAYRATEFSFFEATRSTWDEIVSSGDLGLLPSEAVRTLAGYYTTTDTSIAAAEIIRQSAYRVRVRSLLSHEIQDAISEGCGDDYDERGVFTRFRATCTLEGVSDAEIAAAAQALRRDPQVLADLRYHFSNIRWAVNNLSEDVVDLETALVALQAADGGPAQ
jgi:hypothetical protein